MDAKSPSALVISALGFVTLVFADAQILVDIYLNYDCDIEALENIYEKTVALISKALGTRANRDDSKLTRASLEALVVILRSLTVWAKNLDSTSSPRSSEEPSLAFRSEAVLSDEDTVASSTLSLNDDPLQFIALKNQKQSLTSGIARFNARPQAVGCFVHLNEQISSFIGHCVSDRFDACCKFGSCGHRHVFVSYAGP